MSIPAAVKLLFHLPSGWDDYTNCRQKLSSCLPDETGRINVVGSVTNVQCSYSFPVRVYGNIQLRDVTVGFSIFGDIDGVIPYIRNNSGKIAMRGKLATYNGQVQLNSAEVILAKWVGWMRPKYKPLNKDCTKDQWRDFTVGSIRKAEKGAAARLMSMLDMGEMEVLQVSKAPDKWTITNIIENAHVPRSLKDGLKAHECLDRLAAHYVVQSTLKKSYQSEASVPKGLLTNFSDPIERISSIPFNLTDEQLAAISDCRSDMCAGDFVMHRMLSGDVGCGKTAVYGVVAAMSVDAGGVVIILSPNKALASQIYNEITGWWPDIKAELVLGNSGVINLETRLLIGTTALLNRAKDIQPCLLIVDEQHKFSKTQREGLKGAQTHLLEVTATCIPRSQALMQFGLVKSSRLTMCHVKKNISTCVWSKDGKQALFQQIKNSLQQGWKVLVIYPKRIGKKADEKLPSAEEAFITWEKVFPGQVRVAHGGKKFSDNDESISDLKSGKASILISTTVVEVGLNIPNLRHVMVMHAERFGLTTLHQIRGRIARNGGEGRFDLYLPKDVKEAVITRLSVLEATADGFVVAEQDMRIRGVGDISSKALEQSGDTGSFLTGRSVSVDHLQDAAMTNLPSSQKRALRIA